MISVVGRRLAVALVVVVAAAGVAAVADRGDRAGTASAMSLCGGVKRWQVKTLSDLPGPNAPRLKRDAERRTVDYLVAQSHPAIGNTTPRQPGVESTKYVLKDVTLVEAKVEADQDVHLVIRDDHNPPTDDMIVEFPNVACNVSAPTVYRNQIAKARAAVAELLPACRSGFVKGWAQFRAGTTATIRGVGYFDIRHGNDLHGVAGNEVELHPVLSVRGAC